MNKFKSLFMDCSNTAQCCDKAQYDEASFFEKIQIHIHLLFCKPCKKYTDDNNKLTELVRKANLKSCTEAEKKAWKEEITTENLHTPGHSKKQ